MKKYIRDYAWLFAMAGIVIGVDQWTKALVRTNLAFGSMWAPWDWLLPYARIVHWNNSGAAFGILQGRSLLFTILAFLVTAVIIYYFPRVPARDWTLRVAMGFQLGGAVGNLVDRLFMGGQVTDFISVGNFAVFNVADASITVGVAILLIGVWIKELQEKKLGQAQSQPALDTEPGHFPVSNQPAQVNVATSIEPLEDEKQGK